MNQGSEFSEQPGLLPIGEVASRTGLSPSAIRYYEHLGLVDSPQRINKRRAYPPSAIRRLSLISVAQTAGCSLEEIDALINAPNKEWKDLARRKIVELRQVATCAEQLIALLEHASKDRARDGNLPPLREVTVDPPEL